MIDPTFLFNNLVYFSIISGFEIYLNTSKARRNVIYVCKLKEFDYPFLKEHKAKSFCKMLHLKFQSVRLEYISTKYFIYKIEKLSERKHEE